MRPFVTLLTAAALTAAALPTLAADNTLLIQVEQNGKYRVWHTEGPSMLNDDEVSTLIENATPAGDQRLPTSAGLASAVVTREGTILRLHDKTIDNQLLVDRDDCGGLKLWHADGATQLSDQDLTEMVLTALPGGGKLLTIGENLARAYTANIGVIAVLWKPKKR